MKEMIQRCKANYEPHSGLYKIIVRIVISAIGLFGTMWLAENYFCDTYSANIILFLLFQTMLELTLHVRATISRPRYYGYLSTVAVMGLAGFMLLKSGSHFVNHPVPVKQEVALQSTINDMPTATLVINSDNRIVAANKEMCDKTGYCIKKQNILGHKASEVFPSDKHMYRAVAASMPDGQPKKSVQCRKLKDIRLRKKDGSFVTVEVAVIVTEDNKRIIQILREK